MTRSIPDKSFLILICLLLEACSGTKYLPKGEKLYTGGEIKLETTDKVNKSYIKTVEGSAISPDPNKRFLGMHPKLWRYMVAGENPESKFKKWLKKSGEAPVLISSVKPELTTAVIDAKLFNIGIFKSFSESKIVEKKHTAKVIYTSHIHKPFKVKELDYSIADEKLSQIILSGKKKSFIKPGKDYNLDILKNERRRIDALLKDNGYFFFNPDYLLFKADTSAVNQTISFKLTLKDSIPENSLTVYHINKVFIHQNYSLNEEGPDKTRDTLKYDNNVFIGRESEMNIRPAVILKSVYLKKNEIYSRQNHNITLNRLMSIGNFKFVQVRISESDSLVQGFLDVSILMTPFPKYTFSAGTDLVTKSNNFTGPRMNFSILNRNIFHGAELLNLNFAGSFETQLSGNNNLYSYSFNPQAELTFPRFVVPFKIKRTTSIFLPKTHITFSYNYLKRVNFYDMSTFQLIYGFKWKKNIKTEHELNPINVSNTTLSNQSPAFTELLASDPFLKRSYEEQFIGGGNYSFTYNEQVVPEKKTQHYFNATAEMAGNIFSLAKLTGGNKPSAEDPSRIAGSVYSQYAKFSVDGRIYFNINDKNKFAMRIIAGVARPYGNSSIMPYSRQFFSGGPNSLRAFQINSLGPGTTVPINDSRGFLQLGGDIKLEMNGEYRFGIYRLFKGALFVDAGNVWLEKSNPANTGSPFLFSTFMKETAVGTGIGLRVDASFFILRLDLAMPLRKPWLPENQRWVINQIKFGNSSWRRENLLLNIAIGYPF